MEIVWLWGVALFRFVLSVLAFMKIGVKLVNYVIRPLLPSGKGHVSQEKSVTTKLVFMVNVT